MWLLHSWAGTLPVPLMNPVTEAWKHGLLFPAAKSFVPNQSLA
jgi:hypothetical protein